MSSFNVELFEISRILFPNTLSGKLFWYLGHEKTPQSLTEEEVLNYFYWDDFQEEETSYPDYEEYSPLADEALGVYETFPFHVLIKIEKGRWVNDLPNLKRSIMLAPDTLKVSDLLKILRFQLNVPSEQEISLLGNNVLLQPHMTLKEAFLQNEAEDQLLHIIYFS